MATGQRKRTSRVSKGTARGARKTGPLDPITLILLGKGRMDSRYPLGKPSGTEPESKFRKHSVQRKNGLSAPPSNATLESLKALKSALTQ